MNAREQRFCDEYLVDMNATQAALRAGYSRGTADDAARWLKRGDAREKPAVRARIEAALAERSRRTGVTADRVVQELARIAFVKLPDVVDPKTGRIRADAAPDDLAALAGVRVKDGDMFTEVEAKLCDKNRALELLGKHMGMFTENFRVTEERVTIVDDIPGESDG